MDNDKQTFLMHFEREYQTTKNVIAAFTDDKLDFKPEGKLRPAREILNIFPATEASLASFARGETLKDWKPFQGKSASEILAGFEQAHQQAVAAISEVSDTDLQLQMDFWGMPARRIDALWVMLLDNIHHRGQLTVYLRVMGAVVPSIYGPTVEQPMGGG